MTCTGCTILSSDPFASPPVLSATGIYSALADGVRIGDGTLPAILEAAGPTIQALNSLVNTSVNAVQQSAAASSTDASQTEAASEPGADTRGGANDDKRKDDKRKKAPKCG